MILFYVTSLDVNIASVRYRALLPATYLRRAGFDAKVFSGEITSSVLGQTKCIVFVKAFNAPALNLCVLAKQLGISIILDLCDDIFEDRLGGQQKKGLDRHYFSCMASLASSVTTTTHVLAEVIRNQVPSRCDIRVIPDMAEKLEDVQFLLSAKSSTIIGAGKTKWKKRFHKAKKRSATKAKTVAQSLLSFKPAKTVQAANDINALKKTIIWFGNHGSLRGDSGMAQLLWLTKDLSSLSKEYSIRLIVISNSRQKFNAIVAPLPFQTEYLEWSPTVVFERIKSADVCIIPFASNKFGSAKSPNRIMLALSLGVPVVCSNLPSLGPLKDCVLTENWYKSLKLYFTRPEFAAAHVDAAQRIIHENFSGELIAKRWQEACRAAGVNQGDHDRRPQLLYLVTREEKPELLDTIIDWAERRFDLSVGLNYETALTFPTLLDNLRRRGASVVFVDEADLRKLNDKTEHPDWDALVVSSVTRSTSDDIKLDWIVPIRFSGVRKFSILQDRAVVVFLNHSSNEAMSMVSE